MLGQLRVFTVFSVYEIDLPRKRVRRLMGVADPTPRQGPDGQWQEYIDISMLERGMVFQWGWNADGTARCTWTSDVVSMEEVDIKEDTDGADGLPGPGEEVPGAVRRKPTDPEVVTGD